VMHDRVLFSFHPIQLYHVDKAMASYWPKCSLIMIAYSGPTKAKLLFSM
jgi:hypothetical protein